MKSQNQKDYYAILGIEKNATSIQISQAYRTLALKYHPALHHENPNKAYNHFCQASEAFDVLFDRTSKIIQDQKRKIYDTHGEQALKEGIAGNYKLTTKPQQTFQKFFGSPNVYEHLLEVGRGQQISHPIFSQRFSPNEVLHKVSDLVVPVECSLTQLYNGCNKTLSYTKKVLTADGRSSKQIIESKKIQILPGTSKDSPIIFEQQGNQQAGYKHSRLINQKNFKREGFDLVYEASISLMEALDCVSTTITHLNGQILQVHFDEIISPQTIRTIQGKGMPILNTQQKGNLKVKFNIQFPEQLDIQKKKKIVELLQQ